MANKCEDFLNQCIGASCENPIFTGVENKAWIFNKKDIADFTWEEDEDGNKTNVITAITMVAGKTGYTIDQIGKTPYTGTTTSMTEGNIANTFTENISFVVPDNSPLAGMILDSLANGKYVVIIENEYDGSDNRGKFQVYGAKKGLIASAIENDKYSEDTNGGWSVTLTATNTPNSSLFVEHKTADTVDTKTYLDTLVSCSEEEPADDEE